MKKKIAGRMTAFFVSTLLLVLLLSWPVLADAGTPADNSGASHDAAPAGGGYAATGQIENVGYTTQVYDVTNGLPTSDANFVLGASDGYIWLGGYSGILRYDGNSFTRLDTADGLTSGRGLFEDSKGRIWVGTNDNGVVVLDGNKRTHLTYKEGLPSSSIRVFAEDPEGNVFVATTAGICYVDPDYKVHVIAEKELGSERVLGLDTDAAGNIFGQTKSGCIFMIKQQQVTKICTSEELGMEKITTILADPKLPEKVYLGTESDVMYYGTFGNTAIEMERIEVSPLRGIHWVSYDCNRIWVASINEVGYLDTDNRFHMLEHIPFDSGIEMMTSDYQGNMWFASSTQGVMKIVTNHFVDVTMQAGLPEEVANTACLLGETLYVGTDRGLFCINQYGHPLENELTDIVGSSRVRCIECGVNKDLWVGTFTEDKGLLYLSREGKISSFTTKNGMPDNEIRCLLVRENGTVYAGTNSGIAEIKSGKVTRTIGTGEGIGMPVILSLEEGLDGSILVGTDGDGMYIIDGDQIRRIGRENGLTSDVVMRVRRDEKRGLVWVVTSNSIEYFKNGVMWQVTSFPYTNNYDIYPDRNGYLWIISSYGIFRVIADDVLKDGISDYRLYTVENGLTSIPTAQGYCALSQEGYLYIPGRSSVSRIDIDHITETDVPLKVSLSSVYCGDDEIVPDSSGTYTIPSTGRIKITAAVLDYTLSNPKVQVYMAGKEQEGIEVQRSALQPLEYTGLAYGKYLLHIRVADSSGKNELLNAVFPIVKKPRLAEMPAIRLLTVLIVSLLSGVLVWRVMKSTIVRSQYNEIRRAKEDAERANSAKSRFLANISHEIRTPINTIMGMNEMVMREDATGVPKSYFMSMMNYAFDIRNASESLLSLINDLLDMSKIESGKMHLVEQEYDTQEMLRAIVSMIRIRSTQKELTFDVVIDELLPKRFYGDQGKIKQIVLNLLTNAVKYTDSGGFGLFVSMEEREDDLCRLRFSVVDSGIGIREEDKDKLFTAYERLDEQRNSGIQGTGLGLDISSRFAQLMGGSLTCESVYGKGSTFILTLNQRIIDPTPLGVFAEHDTEQAKGPYVPQFVAPDADVLVVDDNPMNLTVIRGLLKGTKVFVSTAESGKECLEKIRDTRFDVVLLDHMMPGMDGVETVAEIRKSFPDLPVYALTANSAAGEAFYKSKGFTGYLSKPIDSLTLEKTIMRHLPEEIMEKPVSEDVAEELTEIPEELGWIYETEGITTEDGIRNSGGVTSYIFALHLFLDTIEGNAKVIRDAYESGNLRLYTIKVHALKSSARIIGALPLASLCEELEEAGNKENRPFIDENTERLLTEYEAFSEKLSRLKAEPEEDDKEMISKEELKDAYDALRDMIPQMDYDAVELILEELSAYQLPAEDAKRIQELTKRLKLFDWDGMEELVT